MTGLMVRMMMMLSVMKMMYLNVITIRQVLCSFISAFSMSA